MTAVVLIATWQEMSDFDRLLFWFGILVLYVLFKVLLRRLFPPLR